MSSLISGILDPNSKPRSKEIGNRRPNKVKQREA
jgi:hypothetical protein